MDVFMYTVGVLTSVLPQMTTFQYIYFYIPREMSYDISLYFIIIYSFKVRPFSFLCPIHLTFI